MLYDNFHINQEAQYILEQPINNETNNNPINKEPVQADNFGGIFFFNSAGTANASATVSYYVPTITYVPESGIWPEAELQKLHDGIQMENSSEQRT